MTCEAGLPARFQRKQASGAGWWRQIMIAGRSRNTEIIVGVFLLSSMAVLLGMVIFFAGKRQAFEERFKIQTRFSRVAGLETGAAVRLSGINVGKVASIDFDRSGAVLVRMEILGKYQEWIRTNSKAHITTAGLLGDKVIDISVGGLDAEVLEENSILPSEDPIDVAELIELARPAIADLEVTISNLATLTTGLSEGRDRFKSIVENVSSIVEKVDRSEGLLGMLITDRNAADDFSVLMTKARGTAEHAEVAAKSLAVFTADLPELSSKVQVSVDRVEAILGNFQDGSQSFKEAMESLPGIMEKGGSALDEASAIIRNVKEASTDLPEITSRGRRVVRSADELLTAVGRNRLIRGVLSLEEEEEIVEVQISDQRDTAYPH